jgi:hypothetical protein
MSWNYVRVRPGAASMVRGPAGIPLALDPRHPYRSDEQVVVDNPDLFVSDDDLAEEHQRAEDGPIERATRAPGERRGRVR